MISEMLTISYTTFGLCTKSKFTEYKKELSIMDLSWDQVFMFTLYSISSNVGKLKWNFSVYAKMHKLSHSLIFIKHNYVLMQRTMNIFA